MVQSRENYDRSGADIQQVIPFTPLPSHYLDANFAISAKLLIKDRRTRLKEDIIEASECLRHRQMENLVQWDDAENFA
jgi:hypothetical protein